MKTPFTKLSALIFAVSLSLSFAFSASACIDYYDRIPCDDESDCPYGYRCNAICDGPGMSCNTDSDCDAYEAVSHHRDLFCVRMAWESDLACRLSCTPGSSDLQTSCPPGQSCNDLGDGNGACF